MRAQEIIANIDRLGIYSPEQFSQYVHHFSNSADLLLYLQKNRSGNNEIERRIVSGEGVEIAEPDYTISEKVVKASHISSHKAATQGIVSGCFDLLHLGHIQMMQCAKIYLNQYPGSSLLALVLSDTHINEKKGRSRPVLNINERLDTVCALECIDYTTPLMDADCLGVLKALKPDFYFKDLVDIAQEIVRREAELVESYGGQTVFFSRPQESTLKSTTEIIASIAAKSSGRGPWI